MDQTPAAQKNNIYVLVQRNGALMGLGRWDDAAKGVEAGLKISRSPDLLIQEALLKMQRKDPAGARKSAEEALTLAPDNVRALTILVGTYRAQGQAEAGLLSLQERAARYPKSAPIQQYLGAVFLASGKKAEARAAFETAKADNPKSADADLSLAQLDLLDKKPEDARKRLSAVLAKNDASNPAHLMMGAIEWQTGNPAAAIAQYRKVLATDSRNLVALNGLSYLLADQANQPDEALKYAQQAKELAPNDPAVDDTLGWVYFRKGIYSVAAEHLGVAVAKEPNALRKYHLAMAYFKSGDRPRGTAQLNQALKMDSNLPEAAEALQMAAEAGSGAARR
jgi:tetratricopeptide (TPR) repeat protein